MSSNRAKDKERATQLRLAGKSYNEIKNTLNLPSKGTLSFWFKDLILTPQAKKLLASNIQKATERGLTDFNRKRSARIIQENDYARQSGFRQIKRLTNRELMLIGAALYWGEGTKYHKERTAALVFTNSDAVMVRLYMRFIRKIFKISEERIRAGIQIHDNVDEMLARQYWAHVMGVPIDRFYITHQASKASLKKRNPRTLPYGTVSIRVHYRKIFYTVLGMIDGLGRVNK